LSISGRAASGSQSNIEGKRDETDFFFMADRQLKRGTQKNRKATPAARTRKTSVCGMFLELSRQGPGPIVTENHVDHDRIQSAQLSR
jgi:hypothetical protein